MFGIRQAPARKKKKDSVSKRLYVSALACLPSMNAYSCWSAWNAIDLRLAVIEA